MLSNCTNVFLYDNVWLKQFKVTPYAFCLAEATGKLIRIEKKPILLNENDGSIARCNTRVIGVLYAIRNDELTPLLKNLDLINDCSKGLYNVYSTKDTMYREIISVKPIKFNTLDNLSYWRYSLCEQKQAIAYKGNMDNATVKRNSTNSKMRLTNGGSQQVIKFIKEMYK